MSGLAQDLGYAFRVIRSRPVPSTVIVLTLALGIGINTMFFSSFYSMILRPMPFEKPEQLVELSEAQPKLGMNQESISPRNLQDWQQENRVFEAIAPFVTLNFNVYALDNPERVGGARISASLFPLLGIQPILGRNFTAQEDRFGGPPVVLLGHSVWERRFKSDPHVVGQTLYVDDRLHEVVGVMPPGFAFQNFSEIWTPLALDPNDDQRDHRWLQAVARLRPGITVDSAQTAMTLIGKRLELRYPASNTGWNVRVLPLRDAWLPSSAQLGAVAQQSSVTFVLLMVCANVANLMMALATSRRHEIALRFALGAGRARLIRQFLTESTVLAVLGGALGTVLAVYGLDWMKSLVLVPIPYWMRLEIDGPVLIFSLGITVLTGLLFGILPALRGSGFNLADALKAGGGRSGELSGSAGLRNLLVVGQFALSLILVVGTLLMVKSLLRLQKVDVGYNTRSVLTMRLSLSGDSYRDPQRRMNFVNEAARRIAGIANIEAVGAVNHLPASRSGFDRVSFEIEGEVRQIGEQRFASYHTITAAYLQALEIPLAQGRTFTEEEVRDGRDVALVNRFLARELWPGMDPLGRRIRLSRGKTGPWLRVVGIVNDVEPAYQIGGVDRWPKTQIYVPYGWDPAPMITLVARSRSDPSLAAMPVRGELQRLDQGVPIYDLLTLDHVLKMVQWVPRLWSQSFSLFGALALLVAAMGSYAVTSYSVSRRTREMAIRIALGAEPKNILRHIVRQGLLTGLAGVALGLAGALPSCRFLATLLYDVSPNDPLVFGGVAFFMLVVAMLAAYLPARRAADVDPAVMLRSE